MTERERVNAHGEQTTRRQLAPSLAACLRAGRHRQRLTIRQAAKAVGIAAGYLSNLERGLRCPSRSVAQDLARVLLPDRPEEARALLSAARPYSGRDWRPASRLEGQQARSLED